MNVKITLLSQTVSRAELLLWTKSKSKFAGIIDVTLFNAPCLCSSMLYILRQV